MRPKKLEYALTAASTAGFITSMTGAGPFTTIAGKPGDGLGHLVSVTSTANLNTITFTVTGTDYNGNVISATLTGLNNNTVTGTQYFRTVTGVTASSTLGASTATLGWTAACSTPTIPVDFSKLTGPAVGVFRDGTTITWTAQQTNADIFKNPTNDDWQTLGTANSTTDIITQALSGTTAVRVIVASHTTGTLEVTVSQART